MNSDQDSGSFKKLSVEEFIATRSFLTRKLKESAPRSQADFSAAAESLMKLGVIDFDAVDRLLNPRKEPETPILDEGVTSVDEE